jgi:hypothetical protein
MLSWSRVGSKGEDAKCRLKTDVKMEPSKKGDPDMITSTS